MKTKRACCASFPFPMKLQAGLTIEAALVLPMLLMFMLLLLWPIRVMDAERRLQFQMEEAARAASLGTYIRDAGLDLLQTEGTDLETVKTMTEFLQQGGLTAAALTNGDQKLLRNRRLSMESDDGLAEDHGSDIIHMELYYEVPFPGSFFRLPALSKSLVAHRRAWVGSPGGRGRGTYGPADAKAEEEIVYIGKNSTRYHVDPSCHYLSNQMKTAQSSDMEALRNTSGGKYHPCPSCKPGESQTVYYFASGTAYHGDPSCKAITAYVRAVPLREVEYLGACSYCGRGKSRTQTAAKERDRTEEKAGANAA